MAKKMWNPDFFRKNQRIKNLETLIQEEASINHIPATSGIMQTDSPTPNISFRPAPGQKIIANRNSYIVFGKDRPTTLPSGYGGKGAIGCDTIDIVVGRLSSVKNANTKKKETIADNNFGADAARIYISQMTDIDKNFGLAPGYWDNNSVGRSGIGIKADAVRIIGREGVKIVTGKAPFGGFGSKGETNSRGGKITKPMPPIDLIAGNMVSREDEEEGLPFPLSILIKQGKLKGPKPPTESIKVLQPVVRGENLLACLEDLQTNVDEIQGALMNFALTQLAFNSAVSVNLWPANSPHYAAAGTVAGVQIMNQVISNLWHLRIKHSLWQLNYCNPLGKRYICSKSVSAT
mgnify:CR=1 FL=1|tara:strand:- start:32085 stop:33128 length:1044 start_codon:yes stop_codon:yes gene_type:complete